jgi:protein tyrosine/serine phosphatase
VARLSGSTWTDRDLRLGDLLNVRDMGGLELADGSTVTPHALLRGECPVWSQSDIWEPLNEMGVRSVVDLRAGSEAGYEIPAGLPIELVQAPLLNFDLESLLEEWAGDIDVVAFYVHVLEVSKGTIAAATRAVVDAPPGGVFVHCNMGKDRTGLLLALILEAIGGPREELAHDYGLSARRLAERLANWAGEGLSERQQTMRRQLMDSREEQLLAVLEHVDERYGGPRDYLIANGVQGAELDRLKARLCAPALS